MAIPIIEASVSESRVSDFFLGPPVDGVFCAKLKPAVVNAILDGAEAPWRSQVKQIGGLVAYPMSVLQQIKEALAKRAPQ